MMRFSVVVIAVFSVESGIVASFASQRGSRLGTAGRISGPLRAPVIRTTNSPPPPLGPLYASLKLPLVDIVVPPANALSREDELLQKLLHPETVRSVSKSVENVATLAAKDAGPAAMTINGADVSDSLQVKLSSLSEMANGEGSGSSIDGMMDSVRENMMSSAEIFKVSPDVFLPLRNTLLDGINEQLSFENIELTKQNFADFWKHYFQSLDETYKLSEFQEAAISGSFVRESIDVITAIGSDTMTALDLKQNSPFILLIITFFWATIQRRDGIEYGKSLSEKRIQKLEDELKETKMLATAEKKTKTAEIAELRQQMGSLQVQIEALTAAARDLSAQMEKSNEKEAPAVASYVSLAEPPEANSIEISDFIEHHEPMDKIEMTESLTVEETIETLDEPMDSIEMAESPTVEETIETPDEPMDNKEITVEGAIETPDVALGSSDEKIEVKLSKVKGSRKKVASATAPKKKKATTKTKMEKSGAAEKKTEENTPKEATEERDVVVSTTPDWSSLSESTLKRKTVKDLAAYLETKGVDITDTESGKILKKESLVELILVSGK